MAPAPDADLWFRKFHPAPEAPVRLICFPHAGGSASFFLPLAAALAPRVEVLAVQYPGRQDRHAETPIDDLVKLGELVAGAFEAHDDRPYALLGHSMGAVIGFETARVLQNSGRPPVELFASGRPSPSSHPRSTSPRGSTRSFTDDELIAEVRSLRGTSDALLADEEMLRLILPALRADYQAVERYRYQPGTALSCPITAFAGDNDPKATVSEVRSWRMHTASEFRIQVYPGGHFFLVDHRDSLLEVILDRLGTW